MRWTHVFQVFVKDILTVGKNVHVLTAANTEFPLIYVDIIDNRQKHLHFHAVKVGFPTRKDRFLVIFCHFTRKLSSLPLRWTAYQSFSYKTFFIFTAVKVDFWKIDSDFLKTLDIYPQFSRKSLKILLSFCVKIVNYHHFYCGELQIFHFFRMLFWQLSKHATVLLRWKLNFYKKVFLNCGYLFKKRIVSMVHETFFIFRAVNLQSFWVSNSLIHKALKNSLHFLCGKMQILTNLGSYCYI